MTSAAMTLRDSLRTMMLTPALSGREERMMRLMENAFGSLADQVETDRPGNVIARFDGTDAKAPRVMLFAHMDQLGMLVRKINDGGFVRLERLGGVPEKVLPGTPMLLETEAGELLPGVIGPKAHHATPQEEKSSVTPYGALFLDLGFSSREEALARGVQVGCPVVYRPRFDLLGEHRVAGTTVDNRGGCAVLVETARRLREKPHRCTVFVVGTVQEEFNLRGAMVAAEQIRPDIAIALDVVVSGDTPDLKDRTEAALGGGPVLGMYSFHGRGTLNGVLPHPALVRSTRDVAAAAGIPLQRNATGGLLTDLSYVQLVGRGVAPLELSFPARYTHSPVELCDLRDLEGLSDLLEGLLLSWGPDTDLRR